MAKWECYDGTPSGEQGGPTSCKPAELWKKYAEDFCMGRCSLATRKCGVNSFAVSWDCNPAAPYGTVETAAATAGPAAIAPASASGGGASASAGGTSTTTTAASTTSVARTARGDPNAAVTIIEYSDFECPYCGTVEPTIRQIVGDYAGRVKLYFRHYPLSIHKYAQKASEAAECAGDQGKFWEMHDKMFANQEALDVASLKSYAAAVGVNVDKFASCLSSGMKAAAVKADLAEGQSKGVEGTPSFFINGKLLVGAQPYDKFKEAVEAALAG